MVHCYAPRVFAPGDSPFKVKGSPYVTITDHARGIEGGHARFLEHLPDDAHRDFARTMFLPVSQYDALPLVTMTRALSAAEGSDHFDSVRERSRRSAERDLSGVYRLLLKAVSPQNAVERLQKVSLKYFNFGEAAILERQRGLVVAELRQIPASLGAWFEPMLAGYGPVLIERSGGRDADVDATTIPEGEAHGVPLSRIRIQFRWT